jgi:hypothetical protein
MQFRRADFVSVIQQDAFPTCQRPSPADQFIRPVKASPILLRRSSSAIQAFVRFRSEQRGPSCHRAQLNLRFGTFNRGCSRLENFGYRPQQVRACTDVSDRNVVVPAGYSKRFLHDRGVFTGAFFGLREPSEHPPDRPSLGYPRPSRRSSSYVQFPHSDRAPSPQQGRPLPQVAGMREG